MTLRLAQSMSSAEAEGPAAEDTDSRYSVSKVAKKGPNDRESEDGVTLNEANVI